MPFFYDNFFAATSHGTPATEKTHLLLLTASQQDSCKLKALYGNIIGGTAGGARLRVKTADTTPGSGGTTNASAKKHPDNPAVGVVITNDGTTITNGSTLKTRLSIGMAQTGGQGGWMAMDPDAAISLKPNAGVNGNAEISSVANAASQNIDITLEHSQGG